MQEMRVCDMKVHNKVERGKMRGGESKEYFLCRKELSLSS